ncbi:MAG: iron-sulfur cluster assembly scaffold protein [Candidatus Nanoarchaeia archaeon]|nr:iron-sulfur cluster assembly scaffold protein [Candidatus Nanoarchaeia archaeon]
MSDQFTYSKKTIEYFKHPKYSKEIKNADATAELGNLKCGDVFKIFLKIEKGKIKDISYLTYGCMAAIAACEAFCKLVKGKTISQAKKITFEDIKKELEGMPEFKVHCAVMIIETFHKAIKEYENKKNRKE